MAGETGHADRDSERADSRFLLASILVFWLLHYVTLTAQRLIASDGKETSTLQASLSG